MTPSCTLPLIVLFPLVGAIINGVIGMLWEGKRFSHKTVSSVACGSVFLSFIFAVLSIITLTNSSTSSIHSSLFTWLHIGSFKVNFAYSMDSLSAIMTMVVTFIGFLIHIYATGYMKGDKSFYRFFTYLNLFLAAMLNLLLADNLLLMFIGWEGVGLCSYLLIGFWFENNDNCTAGKKAFLVNRVGDFGFILGILTILLITGSDTFGGGDFTLTFSELETRISEFAHTTIFGVNAATLICLFLFIGACGKSAQLPLYVWLPDAMAGPTPVSALIHAATMVTAGIYMIARLSFLYNLSDIALTVVATVGAATAIFAATIAIAQNDIKKVLAYSTVSQLGYMFLAMGCGAYETGIFHVVTHACFKALLFLGAGSVIHGLHHEQDIRHMGGLKDKMPWTYRTFLIGTLAIAGFPLLSGFFSKDEILFRAFDNGNYGLWAVAFLTAILTAIYMVRLFYLTFLGKSRVANDVHPHESPATMTIPLIVLAFLSIVMGAIGIPHFSFIASYLSTSIHLSSIHGSFQTELILAVISGTVALLTIILTLKYMIASQGKPALIERFFPKLYTTLQNKYYVDELYERMIVTPLFVGARLLFIIGDRIFIEGTLNLITFTARALGSLCSRIQTGKVQHYGITMVIGITAAVIFLIQKVH